MNAIDVIHTSGLRKHFGRAVALDGLDLQVAPGEVHGLLGPNGAGKSTVIRVLLGLLRRDGGIATLFGGDPWQDATALHRRLAYVPGDVSLWPNLSGGETIDLLGSMRGGLDKGRRDALVERFELDPRKKGRAYSKGNRQKVALVAALASEAELLILDEPTSGLDPLMEAVFGACVSEAKNRGATVLLSSHILSEVEELCDRVSIIREGRRVDTGTLDELRHLSRTTITATVSRPVSGLDTIAGVHDLRLEGLSVRCQVDPDALEKVLRVLTDAGLGSLVSRPPTLEELFMRYYSGEQRSGQAQPGERQPGARQSEERQSVEKQRGEQQSEVKQ
ncbi:ATP-binding cassette domain-containing protein [Embleya sp. NPDC127516]|uniref:ABC transporter ATP-binding protein n=1 Tax=Embleya sp. NPDC127516 TaxID=3363990 RepID=UPI003803A653